MNLSRLETNSLDVTDYDLILKNILTIESFILNCKDIPFQLKYGNAPSFFKKAFYYIDFFQ